ncbi:MAG: hypothetical protein CL946_13415 [Ectothiorhodospiraceae bacterium]|nr:hypothetical protein [Ectothiorhodospiraceae bacterium]
MVPAMFILSFAFAGIIRHDIPAEEYKKYAQQPQFDCVGSLLRDGEHLGTCVLIGERYVLDGASQLLTRKEENTTNDTIQHGSRGTTVVYKPGPMELTGLDRLECVFNGETYKVEEVVFHPEFSKNSVSNFDVSLAVYKLDRKVTGVRPASLNCDLDEKGSVATIVSIGKFTPAKPMRSMRDGEFAKVAGENMIDSIGGPFAPGTEERMELLADFDHTETPYLTNRMGEPYALPLEYMPTASGGIAFIRKDDQWLLAGICSTTIYIMPSPPNFGYYGTCGAWTRVSVFADWIEEQMK